jgi:hypothetical protein
VSYFQAKSDLHFVLEFQTAVLELWGLEDQAAARLQSRGLSLSHRDPREHQERLQREASSIEGYQQVRERVTKGILRVNRIAHRLRVPTEFRAFPMAALAGQLPIITLSLFRAIICDTSYTGVNRQLIYDALNQTIGECEARVAVEFRRLINPLYWIKEVLVLVIRIPFILIEASGFDVSKVEDHLLAKAFKLLEVVAIIYILIRLGLTKEQLQQVLMTLFPK